MSASVALAIRPGLKGRRAMPSLRAAVATACWARIELRCKSANRRALALTWAGARPASSQTTDCSTAKGSRPAWLPGVGRLGAGAERAAGKATAAPSPGDPQGLARNNGRSSRRKGLTQRPACRTARSSARPQTQAAPSAPSSGSRLPDKAAIGRQAGPPISANSGARPGAAPSSITRSTSPSAATAWAKRTGLTNWSASNW